MSGVTPETDAIAVIIPHYNDPARLRRCLDGLRRNDLTGCDVVVVDNNSPCDLEPVKGDYGEVRFIVEPEKGAGPARNRGVAETTAPILMFIDADCVPADDWSFRRSRMVAPGGLQRLCAGL